MAREKVQQKVPPSAPRNPNDEATPGTPGTGEDICPACSGSGSLGDRCCPRCSGTARVIEGIGGG